MVRVLAFLFVLTITAAGCGDDTGGTGGSAGSGGSAGAGGQAGGSGGDGGSGGMAGFAGDACLDDIRVLSEIEDINASIADVCILGPFNCLIADIAPCVAGCLEDEFGLPQDCGICVGATTDCILRACIGDCTNPDSPECSACIDSAGPECGPTFESCAGFPAP